MGWKWWTKTSDEHSASEPQYQGESQGQPAYETKTYFRSYSSSRSCKPDPEDQNYLICKETTHDGNNTYEK